MESYGEIRRVPVNLYKQMLISFLLRLSSDDLITSQDVIPYITDMNQKSSLSDLKDISQQIFMNLLENQRLYKQVSGMTQQVLDYVNKHYQNQNLTLKIIAENHLYMNVDYVSRKFCKETGKRFSQYLTEYRIEKAQEYLRFHKIDKIQDIAELVGYGNNPQYFSQQFKKIVGTSPSCYPQNQRT